MNPLSIVFIVFAVILFALSIIVFIGSQIKTNKTIDKLNQMLDSAINASFTEKTYDESKLSALEAKLNRYLTSSLASVKNLATEKDRINALISDISHQTKTPIANIVLYSQLLTEQKKLEQETVLIANEISNQSSKLNFLIQALIKTSRLETGIIAIKPQKASIQELIDSVCNDIKEKALEKEIQINISCDALLGKFDFKWTQEALYNIVDNAVKYTPHNGRIDIVAIKYELFTRIDIKDTGMGIDEQDITAIFKRFYRSSQVNSYEGVGIGLFLARQIIASEGGYIKVSSTLGKGSIFSIFLPNEN